MQKNLRIIKFRLLQFNASNFITNTPQDDIPANRVITKVTPDENDAYPEERTLNTDQYTLDLEVRDRSTVLLEKLKFVGEILERYKNDNSALAAVEQSSTNKKIKLEKKIPKLGL